MEIIYASRETLDKPIKFIDSYGVTWKFQFITDQDGHYGVAYLNEFTFISPIHTVLEFHPGSETFWAIKPQHPDKWGAYDLNGTQRASFKYTKALLLHKIQNGY